ncbi:MAG: M23 family metallopeptidase [Ilumatobacter sp.]|uniref:M23 family metallopeptidase n=1 Tax=Ilumatobacter sp. TaxID=1967498 RepID=UPI002635AF6E|nr:M23 family metallopeptidase [Ilumatobacter sp.]MDJ0769070.1 M23 family metallopeptidase [Ilumatobacter sp.]
MFHRRHLAIATAAAAALVPSLGHVRADSPQPPPGDITTGKRPDPPDRGVIAVGETPTIEVIHVESDTSFADLTTQGTVLLAETLADDAFEPPGWWLRLDVRVRNTGDEPVTVTALGITTDVSALNVSGVPAQLVEPDETYTFNVHDVTGDGTPPSMFTVNVYAPASAPYPAQASYDLQVGDNPTATGGYRFPARAEYLPSGAFWSPFGFHSHSRSQRYAYDLDVVRWDEDLGRWTRLTEEGWQHEDPGSLDEHFLIFGQPVFSMADGVIVKCRRSLPDQDPPKGDETASNVLGIVHDNGDYAAYGHLQELSIPAELCPVETPGSGAVADHVPVEVEEGQFLGYAGSSGAHEPHLHIHVQDGGHDVPSHRVRGLPLNFHDVYARTADGYDPTIDPAGDAAGWEWVSWLEAAALDEQTLVHPNSCGWETTPEPVDDIVFGSPPPPSSAPEPARCDAVPDPLAEDPVVVAPVIGGGYTYEPPSQPIEPIQPGSVQASPSASTPSSTVDSEWRYVPVRRYG